MELDYQQHQLMKILQIMTREEKEGPGRLILMLQFYHTTIQYLEVEIRSNRGRGSTVPFCGGGNNGSFLSILRLRLLGSDLGIDGRVCG